METMGARVREYRVIAVTREEDVLYLIVLADMLVRAWVSRWERFVASVGIARGEGDGGAGEEEQQAAEAGGGEDGRDGRACFHERGHWAEGFVGGVHRHAG